MLIIEETGIYLNQQPACKPRRSQKNLVEWFLVNVWTHSKEETEDV